jgi:hypothetical protein
MRHDSESPPQNPQPEEDRSLLQRVFGLGESRDDDSRDGNDADKVYRGTAKPVAPADERYTDDAPSAAQQARADQGEWPDQPMAAAQHPAVGQTALEQPTALDQPTVLGQETGFDRQAVGDQQVAADRAAPAWQPADADKTNWHDQQAGAEQAGWQGQRHADAQGSQAWADQPAEANARMAADQQLTALDRPAEVDRQSVDRRSVDRQSVDRQSVDRQSDDMAWQEQQAAGDQRRDDQRRDDQQGDDQRRDAAVAAPPSSAKAGDVPQAGDVPAALAVAIWSEDTAQQFRDRWRDAQLRFVDDPRQVAEDARTLINELVEALTGSLANHREQLNSWRNDGDTEQYRVVVQRYRVFFDRLLTL